MAEHASRHLLPLVLLLSLFEPVCFLQLCPIPIISQCTVFTVFTAQSVLCTLSFCCYPFLFPSFPWTPGFSNPFGLFHGLFCISMPIKGTL